MYILKLFKRPLLFMQMNLRLATCVYVYILMYIYTECVCSSGGPFFFSRLTIYIAVYSFNLILILIFDVPH